MSPVSESFIRIQRTDSEEKFLSNAREEARLRRRNEISDTAQTIISGSNPNNSAPLMDRVTPGDLANYTPYVICLTTCCIPFCMFIASRLLPKN